MNEDWITAADFEDRARVRRCHGCGRLDELRVFDARPIDGGPARRIALCEACLRDRGAAWRWGFKLRGRSAPWGNAA